MGRNIHSPYLPFPLMFLPSTCPPPALAWQVLDEDLRLVLGQQDRMRRGANVWNHPVIYDKLGVNYRRWRNGVEAEEVSN